MARDDIYKIYQLSNVLISRYEYKQILIDKYRSFSDVEAWFINENSHDYNLIRVTFNTANAFSFDEERISDYINYLSTNMAMDIRFLDIHICNDKHDATLEQYDYLNIEENYSDGKNVSDILPELYNAIHKVENQETEIFSLAREMQKAVEERRKRYIRQHRAIATNVIIGICIGIYMITAILSGKYSYNTVCIFLGASYTTFTVGLKQFYRLLTAGFVHGGFLHIVTNMYSLFLLGSMVERKFGIRKYLLIMFSSIIVGTTCQTILSGNTVIVGISSALYAFLIIFIITSLNENRINFSRMLPIILINLMINFMVSSAWLAHLGGLICGYLYYLIFTKVNNKGYIVLMILIFIGLSVRISMIDTISPVYLATDRELIQMYTDLGFGGYAEIIMKRLIEVYAKYGG